MPLWWELWYLSTTSAQTQVSSKDSTSFLGCPTGSYWHVFRNREVWLHPGILLGQNQTNFLCHSHSSDLQTGREALLSKRALGVVKHGSQVAEGGLVNPTHYRKKAAHHWSPRCHWSGPKRGSRCFDLNIWAKHTVNWRFHAQNICKQMDTASGALSSPSSGLDFVCRCPYRKE